MALLEDTLQPEIPEVPTGDIMGEATTVAAPYTELAAAPPVTPEYQPFISGAEQVGTDVRLQPEITAAPVSDYVTPESTVGNQLATLLAEDSPYMQQAKLASQEEANRLGLLSSSMAVGAGQRAAIQSALPIAQQDAQMYAQLQASRQQAETQGLLAGQQAENIMQGKVGEGIVSAGLTAQSASINQATQNVQNAFATSMKAADAEAQVLLNDVNNRWNYFAQTSLTDLDKQWSERLLQGEVEQERYNTAMNSANQIMQGTQTAITTLMQDPDIMGVEDAASVANMFNTIYDQAQASIEFIGGLGEIPQADFDTMLDAFDLATTFGTADIVTVPTA